MPEEEELLELLELLELDDELLEVTSPELEELLELELELELELDEDCELLPPQAVIAALIATANANRAKRELSDNLNVIEELPTVLLFILPSTPNASPVLL